MVVLPHRLVFVIGTAREQLNGERVVATATFLNSLGGRGTGRIRRVPLLQLGLAVGIVALVAVGAVFPLAPEAADDGLELSWVRCSDALPRVLVNVGTGLCPWPRLALRLAQLTCRLIRVGDCGGDEL